MTEPTALADALACLRTLAAEASLHAPCSDATITVMAATGNVVDVRLALACNLAWRQALAQGDDAGIADALEAGAALVES